LKVDELYFFANFVVLDIEQVRDPSKHSPVILGRQFLTTVDAVIRCRNEVITLSFGNMTVELNVFHTISLPSIMDDHVVVNMINVPVNHTFQEPCYEDLLEKCLVHFGMNFDIEESIEEVNALLDFVPIMDTNLWRRKVEPLPLSTSVPISSIVEPPKLELKPIPSTLKYAFLEESETLSIIISSHLDKSQEEKMLDILGEHREAIGWTIADIKGISPSVVMHQIHLEENAKTSREPQRRLNPVLKEVVRAEIIKLLDASIIYPIFDSQ